MTIAGIRLSDNNILKTWGTVPPKFQLPNGDWIHGAQVGWTDGTYMLVNLVIVENPPSEFHVKTGETPVLVGDTLTVTYSYSEPPDNANTRAIYNSLIDAEKRRRFALGGNVTVSAGKVVSVRLHSINDLHEIILMRSSTTASYSYRDNNGTDHTLNVSERAVLASAAADRERYLDGKANVLKDSATFVYDFEDDAHWTNGG